jgi:hypothetical protein
MSKSIWIQAKVQKLQVKCFSSQVKILKVLDHFTEKSFHRNILTERPFDRNTIWPNTIWPNAIWPKVHSTESPFNRTPFDRKFILPKGHMTDFFFSKWSFDRIYFRQKMSFDRKKKLRTRSFERKFIWPKVHLTESFSENDHLTERSFDWMYFFFLNCRFQKIVIWPTVHIPLE